MIFDNMFIRTLELYINLIELLQLDDHLFQTICQYMKAAAIQELQGLHNFRLAILI